jgi:hypothetical protein
MKKPRPRWGSKGGANQKPAVLGGDRLGVNPIIGFAGSNPLIWKLILVLGPSALTNERLREIGNCSAQFITFQLYESIH